jgi:hypothetical protein
MVTAEITIAEHLRVFTGALDKVIWLRTKYEPNRTGKRN